MVALTTGDALRAREALLADTSVRGRRFCRELSDATDAWLAELFAAAVADADLSARQSLALAAVGGYGRAELAPASDLDVVLLYQGRQAPALVSERLWYPVWDAKLKLGHAVRTVKEALRLAADDLETATSLLTVRHLAGDPELTASLADGARARWRRKSKAWLGRLGRAVEERHAEHGEVAFLLEPNLKEGRGGLRDVHALAWAAEADDVLAGGDDEALREAYDVLLDARVELHRVTGARGDVLALQDQDAVADRLRLRDADAAHGRRERGGPDHLLDQRRDVAPGPGRAGRVRQLGRPGAGRGAGHQRAPGRGAPRRRGGSGP